VVLQLTNEPNQLVKAWTNYNILCSVWGSRSTSIELSHNQNTTTKLNNTQPLSSCEPCSCNPPTQHACLTTWFYDQIASRRMRIFLPISALHSNGSSQPTQVG
jgi:hypothetical protein